VIFDEDVYARIRPGSQRSAAIVVPMVYGLMRPETVVDVGGGEGWWAYEFAKLGARAVCIDDGSASDPAPGVVHVHHDLVEGLPENVGRFDLALSLEVAEHIEPASADGLVGNLCALAPSILFSAAVPGQGGHGHVNEQWPSYWTERFEAHGYSVSGALRWMLWNEERVEYWYRQNLLVATREPGRLREWFETPLAHPWDVVHPLTLARALPPP
jgi:hypothetical protein